MIIKYPGYINVISRNKLVRYFSGTSDTSNAGNSSDASKTSASVTRLSVFFKRAVQIFYILLFVFFFSFQRTLFKLHILWAENFPFRQGG